LADHPQTTRHPQLLYSFRQQLKREDRSEKPLYATFDADDLDAESVGKIIPVMQRWWEFTWRDNHGNQKRCRLNDSDMFRKESVHLTFANRG